MEMESYFQHILIWKLKFTESHKNQFNLDLLIAYSVHGPLLDTMKFRHKTDTRSLASGTL